MHSDSHTQKTLKWVHSSNLLLVLLTGIPLFISSTFLSSFTSDRNVSLIFSLASIASILGLYFTIKILPILGNYRTTLSLLLSGAIALGVLSLSSNPTLIVSAYILYFVVSTLLFFNIDIFLESYSKNSTTGEIRGFTYALASIAWMASPLIAGFILGDGEAYWMVYTLGFAFCILFGITIALMLKDFKDPPYHKISLIGDLMNTLKNKDERNIFISAFILKLFFAWMVIYTPIYLHEYIGFTFQEMGIIFTLMMIPYILLEWPIGIIEDRWYGEKELLMLSFFILAVSTALLSFLSAPHILLWTSALILTRTGAAIAEVSTESYFFKKISSSDTDDISFWRMLTPMGYLFAPIIGFIFLSFLDMRYLFVGIGILMLFGILSASRIKDTR